MGQTIGKYEILDRLGTGGMAVVYRARDPLLGRIVALKVIRQQLAPDEEANLRFLNEAKLAAALTHPNIVGVHELGMEDGRPFIAMEYLAGRDLGELIASDVPVPLEQKLDVALGVARALEYAHAHGVIHRDVKPANIRVLPDGGVKLLDFGIAKLTSTELRGLTKTGMLLGSGSYMSPEQAMGERTLTEATDVFSFGVVLYQLLTGRKPFDSESFSGTIYKLLSTEPEPIDDETVPRRLRELVSSCLSKAAGTRPAGFGTVIAELLAVRAQLQAPGSRPASSQPAPPREAGLAEELEWLEPDDAGGSRMGSLQVAAVVVSVAVLLASVGSIAFNLGWLSGRRALQPAGPPASAAAELATAADPPGRPAGETASARGRDAAEQAGPSTSAPLLVATASASPAPAAEPTPLPAAAATSTPAPASAPPPADAAAPAPARAGPRNPDPPAPRPPAPPPEEPGRLLLAVRPPALVTIDDGAETQTPLPLISLPAGRHTLVLRREGYRTHHQSFVLLSAQTLELDVTLEPARQGSVQIQLEGPESAWFRIDRGHEQRLPLAGPLAIEEGPHALQVYADGYRPVVRNFHVAPDREARVRVRLVRAP